MKKTFFAIILTATGILSASIAARPAEAQSLPPGSLDPTFGNGGIIASGNGQPAIGRDVAVQPDGKIVETGWYASEFSAVRYNSNGILDGSFGSSGNVATNIGGFDFASSMAIQRDGKIVLAGSSWDGAKDNFALVRYNVNGTLDNTFSGYGIVTTHSPLTAPPPNLFNSQAEDVAVQPDGKIVLVGEVYYCAADDFFCDFGPVDVRVVAVRYNADGSLDTTFGTGGFVIEPGYYVGAVAVQPDGKIIAAGSNAVRYDADGSRDLSFGSSGAVAVNGNGVSDMAIQSDGKIIFSTYAYAEGHEAFGIVRINKDGSPDLLFGNGGEVITPGGGEGGSVSNALALQSDGRIVVAGTGFDKDVDWRYVVRRYEPNGALDHSYGTDGIVRVKVGGLHDEGFAVAVDAEGRAVVAGCAFSDRGWGLIRLTGGGQAQAKVRSPFDFDGDGRTDISVYRPSEGNWYLDRSTAGFSTTRWGEAGDQLAPGDYDGDGKDDIAVFRPAADQSPDFYILNSSTNTFTFFNWGEPGDRSVPGDFDGDGRADVSVFRLSNNTWYRLNASGVSVSTLGNDGDLPVPGDYDGDGRTNIAIYRPSNGEWQIRGASEAVEDTTWGAAGDIPVAADYDGDQKDDLAVFRPSEGRWYIRGSHDGMYAVNWGAAGDIPVPGDYDGDGKTDEAIYRDGLWYLLQSTNGIEIRQFGLPDDKPVPSAF